jgi:formate C-acetyltransferase
MEVWQLKRKAFEQGLWSNNIDVRNFIQLNLTPYEGDASFLEGPTQATEALWEICKEAMARERENNGCLDIDTENISSITSHGAGYIDKSLESRPANGCFA